jgi:spermidine synthase
VAVVLVAMAVAFGDWRKAKLDLAVLLVLFTFFAGYLYSERRLQSPYLLETNYFSIRVGETPMTDGTTRKELILDHLIHSYSWVDEPTRLEYGYEKVYAEITSYIARRHPNPDAMFIGGGGYTFPRFMEATYPGSRIDVAEIDPGVTETAHTHLGLLQNTRINTTNEDARLFFDKNGSNGTKYDLIMGDAFNDLSLPYHLTTYEFNEKVKRALRPDGYYMVNVIDNYKTGEFMRAFINTLKLTFRYVYLVGLGQAWESDGSSTYVVLGGDVPVNIEELKSIATENNTKPMTGAFMPDEQLEAYLRQGRPIILTDDYAPIDNLMAPLFVERGY